MSGPKPDPAHVRTRDELVEELTQQLRGLSTLARKFAEGERWAAKLMATIIYVICHDGRGRTKSLLTQLDEREHLKLVTTALDPVPGNIASWPLLLGFRLGSDGAQQIPRFQMPGFDRSGYKRLAFHEWWNQPVYDGGRDGGMITRNELIQSVRSQDGGGHFDAELSNPEYLNFRDGAGWTPFQDDEALEPDPSHLISVWAIGWELHTSIYELDQIRRGAAAARKQADLDD